MKEYFITFDQAVALKELGMRQDPFHGGFYVNSDSNVLYNWMPGDHDMPSGYYGRRAARPDEVGSIVVGKSFTNKKFDYSNPSAFYDREFHRSEYHGVAVRYSLSVVQDWLLRYKGVDLLVYKDPDGYFYRYDGWRLESFDSSERWDTYAQALSAGISTAINVLAESKR